MQEMTRCLTPLLNILAATGRNTDTVMQEVGLMRAGWLACDYRAWLKAYNPDFKRPKLASGTPVTQRVLLSIGQALQWHVALYENSTESHKACPGWFEIDFVN